MKREDAHKQFLQSAGACLGQIDLKESFFAFAVEELFIVSDVFCRRDHNVFETALSHLFVEGQKAEADASLLVQVIIKPFGWKTLTGPFRISNVGF